METRCPECGSWGVQCVSEKPVEGCGCARCLRATVKELRAELAVAQQQKLYWLRRTGKYVFTVAELYQEIDRLTQEAETYRRLFKGTKREVNKR